MVTLSLPSTLRLSDPQFEDLVLANRDYKLELTATGELIIMSLAGGETGNRNFELYIDLGNWNRRTQAGKAFDSSTGFQLPNGTKRSPDLSWITLDKWRSLTPNQRRKFLPLCPDFVVELASESDELAALRQKMQEYLDNGLRLGWLIIPQSQQVEIYRSQQSVAVLMAPRSRYLEKRFYPTSF
jgi:Uma2 family endonuclease